MCWDRVIEAEASPGRVAGQPARLPAPEEPVLQPAADEEPALASAAS